MGVKFWMKEKVKECNADFKKGNAIEAAVVMGASFQTGNILKA